MNKQEAIETIKNVGTLKINDNITGQKVDMVIKNEVLDIISQIDEPQKVVVPKFVAEWIEKEKKNKSRLSHALRRVFTDSNELSLYIKQQEGDYTETIAKAWIYGYTVEKEKRYTVEIPNPNNEHSMNVLMRLPSSGKIALVTFHKPNTSYLKNKEYQLTESEIKEDFDFLWQFAKEVE